MVEESRDEDLLLWYHAATVFAFPSLAEGFGFPPLEAMACGTPVVTSNCSSLPEVVGNAALLADPRDPQAIADALLRVLTDQGVRAALRERGLKRARTFTEAWTAAETERVYQRVAAQP
jgi:glycosyltransferase involved in cell wall biosynthesis